MFFKRRNCPNCDSRFDEMLDYCPKCGMRNDANEIFKRRHPMVFVPWYRELMLFLFGWLGLTLFSLIYSIAFNYTYQADPGLGSMLINTACYVSVFVALMIVVFPYFRDIMLRFKNPFGYMWAGIGVGALLTFSVTYSLIVSFFFPDLGQNGNQEAVSNMVVAYPLISFFIMGIIGPICEELTYRVGLFTLLRRVHPALAYIVTSLLFGFIHFQFIGGDYLVEFINLANYVFAGLCFCFIYEKGGITASLLAHVSNNVLSVFLIIISTFLV